MNVPDLFSKVSLFEGLPPADRVAISRASTLRSYRRGERIVTQGQPGDSFFLLIKGRVSVSILSPEGREVVLSTLSAGDHFGEMALLDDAPRSATVTAAERSDLAVVTREAFFDLLKGNFVLIRALLSTFSRRLRHANATIEGLASLDVKGRLARYFRDLAEERGRKAGGGWTVVVRPSQREIADTIGSSRETVSRTMSQLSRENLIVPKGKAIYVRFEGEAAAEG
jgi:CRP-like cAMP-binding protein